MKYRFGPALSRALQIRGLDMQRVAELANVSPATVSSAVRGRSLNLTTATRIAKVVARSPVLRELEEWSVDAIMAPVGALASTQS
jgi:transcriptional regulator with XRE-family HTH domain